MWTYRLCTVVVVPWKRIAIRVWPTTTATRSSSTGTGDVLAVRDSDQNEVRRQYRVEGGPVGGQQSLEEGCVGIQHRGVGHLFLPGIRMSSRRVSQRGGWSPPPVYEQ